MYYSPCNGNTLLLATAQLLGVMVAAVHDLHVWALGSQEPILTAHVLLAEGVVDADRVRAAVAAGLHETFAIDHATLQVEAQHCGAGKLHD